MHLPFDSWAGLLLVVRNRRFPCRRCTVLYRSRHDRRPRESIKTHQHLTINDSSESHSQRLATCCSCSAVVSIRATGAQNGGSVSIKVGRLCVSKGFMYFVSKPPQIRASQALSDAALLPGITEGSPAIPASSTPPCVDHYCVKTSIRRHVKYKDR